VVQHWKEMRRPIPALDSPDHRRAPKTALPQITTFAPILQLVTKKYPIFVLEVLLGIALKSFVREALTERTKKQQVLRFEPCSEIGALTSDDASDQIGPVVAVIVGGHTHLLDQKRLQLE
jgi:hypothetical protein